MWNNCAGRVKSHQVQELDIISESRAGRQDGGVQQLVPERDERSGNRVPASGSECWHQRAEDLAKWSAAIGFTINLGKY